MQLGITTDIMFLVLKILAAVALTGAFLCFAFELLDFPALYARKNVMYLSRKAIQRSDWLDNIIRSLSKFTIKFVRINSFKRKRLATQFENLDMKMSPEEFYAEIIAKALLLSIFVPVGFFIHIAIGLLLVIVVVLVILLELNKISSIIQKKKEAIESELPRFVSVIEQTFKNDHDVIKLISTYVENGDSPLIHELNIALADMKTGDFETALTRLSNRVNSVFLSEVVRGLQSALHGDDTVGYFASLSSKLWDHEKARIKKKALKTPGKVKYLVKAMLISMFLIYVTVFGTVIYEGLSEVFTMM